MSFSIVHPEFSTKMRDCDTEKLVYLVAMSQTFILYV